MLYLSLFNLFKRNKLYAKSVACHQLNLMKDKRNIILILTSSDGSNSSSGVAHDINSFFLKCSYLFFPEFQVFSRLSSWSFIEDFARLPSILSSFISCIILLIRRLVMVVLQGCDFLKVFFKIPVGVPQVFFLLHLQCIDSSFILWGGIIDFLLV